MSEMVHYLTNFFHIFLHLYHCISKMKTYIKNTQLDPFSFSIYRPMFKLTVLDKHSADIYVECHQLTDLEDYCQPHAPGSLLKAAIVCVDLVDIHSSTPLSQQLMDTYGSGFEIQSWSNLPHGSGTLVYQVIEGEVI